MKRNGNDESANGCFVFRGTVIAAPAPRRDAAPGAAAVVRVDEVLEAPSFLIAYNGRDVTVVPPPGKKLAVGETHVFHGGGYEFGEGLTLEAAVMEPVSTPLVAARALGRDPRAAAADRRMQQRLQQASLVVAGVVETVRLPRPPVAAAARVMAHAPTPVAGPISEHDPHWREAVVQVAQVHKGEQRAKEVVVRFAASNDVRWFKAPKLQPGQKGIFSLHSPEDEPSGPPLRAARAVAAKGPRVYAALDPADVQPLERQEDVERLMVPTPPPPAPPRTARAAGARARSKAKVRRRRGAGRAGKGGR